MAMLVTLARLHRRQTAEAEAKLEAQAEGVGASTPVRRSSWLVLARVAVREPAADRRQHRGAGGDAAVQVR
ncbi:hypothetical protein G6F31_020747 [Rhizopus arrhizus]|nr:hypothetical protein G6F31_020747 [Rhizopus arrhizus]